MAETSPTSYDEVPYGSNVFYYTHPDRLAVAAALLGLEPPPVDHCRVLELGCGTGANLLPMAQDLPGSTFVGIDLSPRQIGMGQSTVDELRLNNIELKALSIMDVDKSFGSFDYIIAHGVYSWVPPEVQDKILTICANNLGDNGVAYVSYNTYPGWHVRGMIREVMGYHVRRFAEPEVRVRQARFILDFLIRAVGDAKGPYGSLLQFEADMLAKASDTYLYHEHLEEVNHPLYFHQFAERASAKGLQYLGEVLPSRLAANLAPEVVQTLEEMTTDLIQGEQYLDFVRNRTFRRTLVCHDKVQLRRPPSPEAVMGMSATGLVTPVSRTPDVLSSSPEVFQTDDGARLTTNNPLVKRALLALAESWPRAMAFEHLWEEVRSSLAESVDPSLLERGRESLAETLLQCYLSHLVALHRHAPRLVVEVSERPVASPLARSQSSAGRSIPNLRHCMVELSDFEKLVLRALDGSRDRAALVDHLAELVATDVLTIHEGDRPLKDPGRVRALLAEALEPCLRRLASSSLLVG